MDKKNTFIGVALLIAAFASFFFAKRFAPPPPPAPSIPARSATLSNAINGPSSATPLPSTALDGADATFAAVSKDDAAAETIQLSNDYIAVDFTNFGGST